MKVVAGRRGLRYPDEYVVKMFFKEGLERKPGHVLELGCGSANNLMLFAEFDWRVTGVDYDDSVLADAEHNLSGTGTLVKLDLSAGRLPFEDRLFNAILLPSVGYYIPRSAFIRILTECRRVIRPDGMFYIRSRLPNDWRWGRGPQEEPGGFRLECSETGERGLLNVFYEIDELSALISQNFGELKDAKRLQVSYDNPQNGVVVHNSDVVVWGLAVAP